MSVCYVGMSIINGTLLWHYCNIIDSPYPFFAQQNVLTWHHGDTSLTQLDQELPSPAHCLLVSHGNESPVVVLCNGSVHVLGTEIKRNKKKTKTK